jgi:hypothetical protein
MPWKSLSLAVKLNVIRNTEAQHQPNGLHNQWTEQDQQCDLCIWTGVSEIKSMIYFGKIKTKLKNVEKQHLVYRLQN